MILAMVLVAPSSYGKYRLINGTIALTQNHLDMQDRDYENSQVHSSVVVEASSESRLLVLISKNLDFVFCNPRR